MNFLLLEAKWYILKYCYTNWKPLISILENEIKQYIDIKMMKHSTNAKSVKTFDLCVLLNVLL